MGITWAWIGMAAAMVCLCIHGASCANTCGKGVTAALYEHCNLLPALGASLAWTLDSSSSSIHFAFTEDLEDPSGWVAWGINPAGATMAGTQALGAFLNSSTGVVAVFTYDLTQAVQKNETLLVPGPVTVAYSNYSATATADGTVTISGAVELVENQSTVLNLVWNRGPSAVPITGGLLRHHLSNDNLHSAAVVDMSTGQTRSGGQVLNQHIKRVHGIINILSWGILLPIGVMAARYLRPFEFADPAWFYLHVFCQITGYLGGTAGWVLGLRFLKYADPIKHFHRNMGIAIWSLAMFQVLVAILLRPMPKTKTQPYWNAVHHVLGYVIIIVAIVNVFEGIHVLGEDNWKRAYVIVLAILGLIAIVMELIIWFYWMQKREERPYKRSNVLIGDPR